MVSERTDHHERVSGSEAYDHTIDAVVLIADMLRTTLGPYGMDKLLLDRTGNVTVTNDGATILEAMDFNHPISRMLVDLAKTQEEQAGDATTSTIMLAGELLRKAKMLLHQGVHPTMIIAGYRKALAHALTELSNLSFNVSSRQELVNIALTALNGKNISGIPGLASLLVEVADKVSEGNTFDNAAILLEQRSNSSQSEVSLIDGIMLSYGRSHHRMPCLVTEPKILLLDDSFDDHHNQYHDHLRISGSELSQVLAVEEERLRIIMKHVKESGTNIIFSQKSFPETLRDYFSTQGIFVVSRVTFEDLEKIALATGARIMSNINQLTSTDLGVARTLEEKSFSGEPTIFILGCKNPKITTILVQAPTLPIVEEYQRAINDVLGDLKATVTHTKILVGAGASELALSSRIKTYAETITKKEQRAVLAFAESLTCIPEALAKNAGLNSEALLQESQKHHNQRNHVMGISLDSGRVEDMKQQGILEPLSIKVQALHNACDFACTVLRIDDIIAAKSIKEQQGNINRMAEYDEGE